MMADEDEKALKIAEPVTPQIKQEVDGGPSPPKIPKVEFPDDAFLMITQLPWEEEVCKYIVSNPCSYLAHLVVQIAMRFI